jgi:hypothetical protein
MPRSIHLPLLLALARLMLPAAAQAQSSDDFYRGRMSSQARRSDSGDPNAAKYWPPKENPATLIWETAI